MKPRFLNCGYLNLIVNSSGQTQERCELKVVGDLMALYIVIMEWLHVRTLLVASTCFIATQNFYKKNSKPESKILAKRIWCFPQ